MVTRLLEQFGPSVTPRAVRIIITVTSILSIFAALADGLLHHLGLPGLEGLLTLTMWGITHGLIWQPFTYFFISPTYGAGVSFGMIISLLFQMYILWIAGTALVERVGEKPFLRLYLLSGVLAGLTALAMMTLTGTQVPIAGAWPSILAVLIVWAMLYPDTQILLFLTIPVKTMWLIFGYLGIVLLVDLSQLNFVDLSMNIVSAGTAYLYATAAWGMSSPFTWSRPLDDKLNGFGETLRTRFSRHHSSSSSKIVYLWGKEPPQSDEDFLEAMLTKISQHGERSLSWRERRRLHRISRSKRKQ